MVDDYLFELPDIVRQERLKSIKSRGHMNFVRWRFPLAGRRRGRSSKRIPALRNLQQDFSTRQSLTLFGVPSAHFRRCKIIYSSRSQFLGGYSHISAVCLPRPCPWMYCERPCHNTHCWCTCRPVSTVIVRLGHKNVSIQPQRSTHVIYKRSERAHDRLGKPATDF